VRTRKRAMRIETGNDHERLEFRQLCVWVNLPSPKRQVPNQIWLVISPIPGLPNPIRQVLPLIFPNIHIFLMFITHLPLSRPQLYHLCRTQSPVISRYLSMPLSLVDAEYSIRQVQHRLSTAYNEHSVHWVRHPLKKCLCSRNSHDYKSTTY